MNEQEIKLQMARVTRYHELAKVRDEIRDAIKAVTEGNKDGPCGQGPFTSNTRESRQVHTMLIKFTATRGGAQAVDMNLSGLHIEAPELGRALENMLRTQLAPIVDEIEKL